ncbi:tudor and KH domain containing L homeolog [Xenopus laevis]|uniref:MGC85144 protein n=1 Tax=Xenopus laevis TaxID=8355 RepID=Q5EAU7_XENLA|nr:tudor and KH domain containing L homeolog [Xenopus laevis]AAH90237.1 MGC85144 protein [Xenopus laevis]
MSGWNSLSAREKMVLTVGVSAGAVALYVCYSKYRDRSWEKRGPQRDHISPSTSPAPRLCVLDGEIYELHMKVPSDSVKLLIGKEGNIRKRVRKQTDAHIQVKEIPGSTGKHEVTLIGTQKQVFHAQEMVNRALQESTILQVELMFPSRCMGRIIGQGGERIRAITRNTGAKIECEPRTNESKMSPTRRITVTGTKEQVEAATFHIQKVSEEEQSIQQRAAESSAFRCRRKDVIAVKKEAKQPVVQETNSYTQGSRVQEEKREGAALIGESLLRVNQPSKENVADTTYEVTRFEVPSPDYPFRADEYVDVYVSAVENPEHFWIQILGSRSTQLDKLTSEMTEHYQNKKGGMTEIQVGGIVAAPFRSDNFWYRAKVLGFLENGNVDLYFVDYGDNWETGQDNLFPLRHDFLSLPFQAIECGLSKISPNGATWTEEALVYFEDLTHCALWKPLMAKISSFPSPGVSCFQVLLFDSSTDPVTDIRQKLIVDGFAVESKESPQREDEEGSLVARLLDEVTSLSLEPETISFSSRLDDPQPSDGSIELMRADPEPKAAATLGHKPKVTSTPVCCPRAEEEQEGSLEESIAKITIGDSEGSLESGITETASENGTTSYEGSSKCSKDSSIDLTGSFTSEEQSSSQLEDSSIYSPRGCFYYLTDEPTSSSIFYSSSCDAITISSESEEEAGLDKGPTNKKKTKNGAGTRLSSLSPTPRRAPAVKTM